jgi:transcriptional regulator with XRE-family HTH domain
MTESINARIRRYRKAAHLTQSQLGEMLEIKTSTYSQMERNGQITCDMLLRLANVLKIDVSVLLLGENICKENKENTNNIISIPQPFENKNTFTTELTMREYKIIQAFRNLSEQKKIWACENVFNLLLKRRKNPPKQVDFLLFILSYFFFNSFS